MSSSLKIFVLFLAVVEAKRVIGTIRLSSEDTEAYLTKMSLNPTTSGLLQATFTSLDSKGNSYFDNHNHNLMLGVFNDASFARFNEKLKAGSLCEDRMNLATKSEKMRDNSGTNTFSYSTNLEPHPSNTHYWYIVIFDCELEWYPAHPPALSFDILIMNGDSHLPADEDGLPTLYLGMCVIMGLGGIVLVLLTYHQSNSQQQMHFIVLLLLTAYGMQFLSLFLEWLHLRTYAWNGLGLRFRYAWFPADFLSEMCQGLSEQVISFVLVALAFGWTILEPPESFSSSPANGTFMSNVAAKVSHGFQRISKLSMGVFAAMFVVQFTLELMGRGYEDEFNQFHDYEHWPGYCLMAYRVLLGLLFVVACSRTLQEVHGTTQIFLWFLRIFGLAYFLTFPVVVLAASFFPAYNRHAIVSSVSILIQTLALAGMTKLLLFKGSYHKISSVSQGILAGGGGSSRKKFMTE